SPRGIARAFLISTGKLSAALSDRRTATYVELPIASGALARVPIDPPGCKIRSQASGTLPWRIGRNRRALPRGTGPQARGNNRLSLTPCCLIPFTIPPETSPGGSERFPETLYFLYAGGRLVGAAAYEAGNRTGCARLGIIGDGHLMPCCKSLNR